MTNQIIPTSRVRGLEALELAGAAGLDIWLLRADRPDEVMTASQAWARIRNSDGQVSARDFYTFEPANEVLP